jgi:hypothetical protein
VGLLSNSRSKVHRKHVQNDRSVTMEFSS